MPSYKLRKVPKKDLYWVVSQDGTKHSKEGMPKDKAEAQKRILEAAYETEIKGGDAVPNTQHGREIVCGFPLKTYWTAASQSYKLNKGQQPLKRIGEGWRTFDLIDSTPTLLFYVCQGEDDDGNLHPTCLVAVRGSATAEDWKANSQIPLNKLHSTPRYQKDLDKIKDVRIRLIGQYGQYHVKWIGAGHSLGGALMDILIASHLVECAVTYNPAVESQYRNSTKNHRIYHEHDPLYFFMGKNAKVFQVRKSNKSKTWVDWALYVNPWAKLLVSGYQSVQAHFLDNFVGGSKKFKNILYGGILQAEFGTKHSKEEMPKDKAEAAYETEIKGGDAVHDTQHGREIVCGFPLKTYWTAASQSYKLNKGEQPLKRIGEGWRTFDLIDSTPTLLFYMCEGEDEDGNLHPTCLVAVRGSATAEDWKANSQIPLNKLHSTPRYLKDLDKIKDVRIRLIGQYGQYHVRWIGAGHSLGGALMDILIASHLVECAVTYNPAVESQYRHSTKNHRIYHEHDPLYFFMGKHAKVYQVRKSNKSKTWVDWALYVNPWAKLLVSGYQSVQAHFLDNFVGGSKKFKNVLYGGALPAECGTIGTPSADGKRRNYTQDECDQMGGVFDDDTSSCFVNGVNMSEKCVDSGPAPAPPEPFKPVPYEPGKPDIKPMPINPPEPKPFEPIPYEPGKPDTPVVPPEPFKPVPYEPGKPDIIPADILPGVRRPCSLPGGANVELECFMNENKRIDSPEWDNRMTIMRAVLINDQANNGDVSNSPLLGACCGMRVKINASGQMVYDKSKYQNNADIPCGIVPYGGEPPPRCSDYNVVNDGQAVANPDRLWENLSKLVGDWTTTKKQVAALAAASWMDALLDQKIYDKTAYRNRIKEWCKQNPVGPCAKPSGMPFTPDQKFNNCMAGFPYSQESFWKVARDALYYRRDEKAPQGKGKAKRGSASLGPIFANYPDYSSQIQYKQGDIVKTVKPGGNLVYWRALKETKGNEPAVQNSVFWESYTPGNKPPPPAPAPYIPTHINDVDYTRPKDAAARDAWEAKYGTTYAQYQENRDKTCQAAKNEANIDNFEQWWSQVGSKINSPCPNAKDQSDPYIYAPYTNVKQPICRQWRVDGTNLTASTLNDPALLSYRNRIRPTGWDKDEKGNPIDKRGDKDKWVWQHDTTYPRDAIGLHVAQPGGCDFPPVSGSDPNNYQASPEECFERQVAWRALAEADIENAKCKGDALDCIDWKKIGKDLTNLGINELVKFLAGDSSGKFLPKLVADLLIPVCDKNTKCDFKALDETIQSASQEVINLLLGEFNKQQSALPPPSEAEVYLSRFGEDKKYPGFTDPVLRDPADKSKFKVWPDETPPERRSTFLERRRLLDEQFTENFGDVDALGYHGEFRHQPGLPQDQNAAWRVRGGVHPSFKKYFKLADRVAAFIHKHAKALYDAKKKTAAALKGGAHAPHSRLAAHLRKIGVSADKYLAEARRKATQHGLPGNMLGWADSEAHKFQIPNEEGKLVEFGAAGMGDHILYTLLRDPKAAEHRRLYHARAENIHGNWKKSKFSRNSLALAILW
jgi:hypothetical protein